MAGGGRVNVFTIFLIVVLPLTSTLAGEAGGEWNPPVRITSNDHVEKTYPGSVAIDGNDTIHVLWREIRMDSGVHRILYMEGYTGAWGEIKEIVSGGSLHSPHLAAFTNGASHIVWQEGTGDGAEIRYATNSSGTWVSEPVTDNATEDIDPAVAVDGDNAPHIAWAGYDPSSGEGKIFYGKRSTGGWILEILSQSTIGDFWTGANPAVAVSPHGIVQITYRGGNYGFYHIHQATKAAGNWIIQTLTSGNANDFSSSVHSDVYGRASLAMSGNDGWGFPSRTYYTESQDGGMSWSPRELASGAFSLSGPSLGADWHGKAHMACDETSGNFYTGTIYYVTNQGGFWTALPITGGEENYSPSLGVDGSGFVHIFYENTTYNGGEFNTEVFYLTNHAPTVTLSVVPQGETVIPKGGSLTLDLKAKNGTENPREMDFWITGILPGTGAEIKIPSAYLNFPNPVHGWLPPGMTVSGTAVFSIPQEAPAGLFTLTASVGKYGEGTYLDRSAVSVRIVP